MLLVPSYIGIPPAAKSNKFFKFKLSDKMSIVNDLFIPSKNTQPACRANTLEKLSKRLLFAYTLTRMATSTLRFECATTNGFNWPKVIHNGRKPSIPLTM